LYFFGALFSLGECQPFWFFINFHGLRQGDPLSSYLLLLKWRP